MIKDIILVIIILAIVFGAGLYLYRAKKRGEHCVGCPYSKECGKRSCNCSRNE